MVRTNYNERSWAIDLISDINVWLQNKTITIARAGGEHTLKTDKGTLFPDLLLFGDQASGLVLQGWELKMPDTAITDPELIENAKKKAQTLGLGSFLVWNVTTAVLYTIDGDTSIPLKTWNGLKHITTRSQVLGEMERIRQQLGVILEDLNRFLQDGTIRPAAIVDSVTSEGLTDALLSNVGAYASSLQDYAHTHYKFEDEITLWWLASKKDYPNEDSQWEVLARNNLVTLFNKFVFAHALKQWHTAANLVDDITEQTSAAQGLATFGEISTSADFWNIFSSNLGEAQLPATTWAYYASLNAMLKDYKLTAIDSSFIHKLLHNLSLKTKQKVAGQFATPYALAKLAASLVVLDPAAPVLDPCCGTGTIAKAVYDLKVSKGITGPLESTWASDRYALPLKMATLAIIQPENMGEVLNIFSCDATRLSPDTSITVRDPHNGNEIIKKLPEFSYIISNLPFVQQESLAQLNPDIAGINQTIQKLTGNPGLSLDKRSDLYAYLPFYLWKILKKEGKLGIIISNSWLATEMGEKFFKALRYFYSVEAVITSGQGKWFDNAEVVTNILILQKNDTPSTLPPAKTKFVVLNKSLADIHAEQAESAIRALIHTHDATSNELLTVRTYRDDDFHFLEMLHLPKSACFADLSWLQLVKDATIPARQIFTINRGERRGWDALFLPPGAARIEAAYLKPILKTPRSMHRLTAEADSQAFCCTLSQAELRQAGHNDALAWIAKFEHLENGQHKPLPIALARKNAHWYTMRPDTMADIVTAVNAGERLFFGRFTEPTFVNQRLIRFTRQNQDVDVSLAHALLNSIVGLFYLEALGFGRGQGALDLNTTKVRNSLRMLDPSHITPVQRTAILQAFTPLLEKPVQTVRQALEDSDRQTFDRTVLRTYHCEQQYAAIKQSLFELHTLRMTVHGTDTSR